MGRASFIIEGGDINEQERFSNFFFSNDYLPFTILTIHSINIKENYLTNICWLGSLTIILKAHSTRQY